MVMRSSFSTVNKLRLLFQQTLQSTICSLPPPISPHPYKTHHHRRFISSEPLNPPPPPPPPPPPELVNDICRILSDYRNPQNDLESALNSISPKLSPNLVEQVLKRCKNLTSSAHRFFIWAKQSPGFSHTKDTHHILVDILGTSKHFPLIWDHLADMKATRCCDITPEIFHVIFRSYIRAHLPADAITAFHKMVGFGIEPCENDVDCLLHALCKKKQVKEAQAFFDTLKSELVPSAKTYSILMKGWGDIGECEEARKVFDEMLQRGCKVDLLAINSFLQCLCKKGNVDEAYRLFNEMKATGPEPDAFSYSIFIRASCDANDVKSAFRVLDRMKRYGLVPNVYTYNQIIKTLCKNDMVEECYQVLDEMIESGLKPDSWSYNTILARHCSRAEVNRALRLVSRMEKDSCPCDRHTYNMVLKMLIRIGRFDRVKKVWERMELRGFHPSVPTYSVMVHELVKKRRKLEEACRYFEMMIDEGLPPYSTTCEIVRNQLIGRGFVDQTEILADKMERSSSCSIQELSKIMRGSRSKARAKTDWECSYESDYY